MNNQPIQLLTCTLHPSDLDIVSWNPFLDFDGDELDLKFSLTAFLSGHWLTLSLNLRSSSLGCKPDDHPDKLTDTSVICIAISTFHKSHMEYIPQLIVGQQDANQEELMSGYFFIQFLAFINTNNLHSIV